MLPEPALQRTRARVLFASSPLSSRPLLRSAAALLLSIGIQPFAPPYGPTETPKAGCSNWTVVEAMLTPDGHAEWARVVRSAGADFDRKALDFVKARRYRVPKNNRKEFVLTVTVWPHEIR